MPDDRLIFAPTPRRITFVIRGRPVETELYKWLDLPVKDGHTVHGLEEEMRALGPGAASVETLAYLQKVVRIFCPALDQHALEELTPRQLQEAITTAYAADAADPPAAVEGPGAASPSPSAASTTGSPAPIPGGPPSSAR